jgi:TolB-like protein/Flp pilus assembly protein TadD
MTDGGAREILYPNAAQAPLFISYASEDAEIAARLCAALEAAHLPCWMAPRDVRAGESYAAAIVQAINSCRALVLVLSRSAAQSPHVLREVERAASKRRRIVAVRIDDVALPPELEYFLSANQWLDASGGRVQHVLPGLLAALGAGEAGAPATPSAPLPAPRRTRRAAWVVPATLVASLGIAVLVIWWVARHAAGSSGSSAVPAGEPGQSRNSVAVLPFADLSEKRDQQYFADGLAEELIDRLAKVPQLRVPARASSFYFKERPVTLAEIAAALKVTHVLEGSVRKAGNEVRISAELVRVTDDSRIWSATYDRRIDDIFKAQDEIASAVVSALEGSLLKAAPVSSAPTTNGEAYTIFLQGRAILRGGGVADYLKAIEYYQRAVARDPTLAVAWAAIANTTADAYGTSHVEPRAVAAPRAHGAVERALALDPNSAAAYVALGRVAYFIDNDWETARNAFGRAIELDSNIAEAMRLRSYLEGALGDLDAQRRDAAAAIAHDPLDYWNYFAAGIGAYNRGEFADGERWYRKAIELNERAEGPHSWLAILLVARAEPAAALTEAQLEPNFDWKALTVPIALRALGRHREADAALAALEARYAETNPYFIALSHAARKDMNKTFGWLDRAVAQHDLSPVYQRFDPLLKFLTQDPRYRQFLHKANLPPPP